MSALLPLRIASRSRQLANKSHWGPSTISQYLTAGRLSPRMPLASSHHARMNSTRSFPALFVRGGTSNGLVVMRADLPPQDRWHEVLPAAMGSPDPYGRQLDGMGGGISSTSKICVLSASSRPDADVDFTFVQVSIRDGALDLAGNCGNMSSAVGPVAWDQGLVLDLDARLSSSSSRDPKSLARDGGNEEYREATVRFFNTNTSKLVHSRFRVTGDNPPRYCPAGDYAMDGVPGTQSCITMSFLDPAGAKTGKALPTGNPVDVLEIPLDEAGDGGGNGSIRISASLVDVSNPGVFVRISDLGGSGGSLTGVTPQTLTPAAVDADTGLKKTLEAIRRAGAVRMGLDPEVESVPKIVLLFDRPTEDSVDVDVDVDVQCLALSMGQPHKAVPLTLALCLGAAANIPGTVAAQVCRRRGGAVGNQSQSQQQSRSSGSNSIVIGHPSGKVEIGTTIENGRIVSADLLRTARVLMKGDVYY
ncbi:2-methylaconitate isomerase [Microdochium nivale]|nr:2-methylaconitate isomerase [Microdochium nivale]